MKAKQGLYHIYVLAYITYVQYHIGPFEVGLYSVNGAYYYYYYYFLRAVFLERNLEKE